MPIDLDKLTTPFPHQALKQREGGRGKMLTYVEGHTVIHRLNDATANHWDFRVLTFTTTPAGKSFKGADQTLYTATVELCIPGLGCRQHVGVQLSTEGGGEDLVKGAVTDGLKKAATLFGVGLELYGPDYEAGEIPAPQTGNRPTQTATNVQPIDADAQRMKRLHAVADKRGLNHDDLHAIAKGRGKDSLKDLTAQEMDAFTNYLERVSPPALQVAIDSGRETATAK